MLQKFFTAIHEAEQRIARSFGKDISTPWNRLTAWIHFHLFDHGILRTVWTNLDEIAPGVWRSNQPSPRRLRRYKRMGIETILNLRGEDEYSYYLFEKEAAAKLGIEVIDVKIYARRLVERERLLDLLDVFERIPRPFVMHCKSGADRAGLASALWLLHMEGASIAEAKKQLSLRYVHLDFTRTGILDQLLEEYEADTAETHIPIREWLETHYNPRRITNKFLERRGDPAMPEPQARPTTTKSGKPKAARAGRKARG